MAHLKDLKLRIRSVKSTQKITKAMKMVSASKLKRARDAVEVSRPYTQKLNDMTRIVANNMDNPQNLALLYRETPAKTKLFVVLSSDRGLCGALNSSIVRMVKRAVAESHQNGEQVQILCIGKKAYSQLSIIKDFNVKLYDQQIYSKKMTAESVHSLTHKLIGDYLQGSFDACIIFYNRFNSAVSYTNSKLQLIPLYSEQDFVGNKEQYDFEPVIEEMIPKLIDRNIIANLYSALLENIASEHGARMTAMENATTNAGEMIKDLSILYNRKRQAAITKELIEIISGAEAV